MASLSTLRSCLQCCVSRRASEKAYLAVGRISTSGHGFGTLSTPTWPKSVIRQDAGSSTIKAETVRGLTVRTSQLFQTALAPDDRHSFFHDARQTSERPGEPLSDADATAQPMPDASPAKWPQIGRAHDRTQSLMRTPYAVYCMNKK